MERYFKRCETCGVNRVAAGDDICESCADCYHCGRPIEGVPVWDTEPGGPAYFLMAGLGGALVNAGLPLKIVTAQELAPRAVPSASGMLMGFAMGVAGLVYVGVGALQEAVGLAPAASLVNGTLAPTALLAFIVLSRHEVTGSTDAERRPGSHWRGYSAYARVGIRKAAPVRTTQWTSRRSLLSVAHVMPAMLCRSAVRRPVPVASQTPTA